MTLADHSNISAWQQIKFELRLHIKQLVKSQSMQLGCSCMEIHEKLNCVLFSYGTL